MKQHKIIHERGGRDTHVRSNSSNIFTKGNYQSNQLIVGEVLSPEPEPVFKQNMVTVKLARGGQITSVAMPNAFISPVTGNLHGLYEGLTPGQMVMVGFENGNQSSPFIANRYPYQGRGNSLFEYGYSLPTVSPGIGNQDIRLGHISGSYLSFNSGIFPNLEIPGSVTLSATTNMDISSISNMTLDSILNVSLSGLSVNMESTLGASISCQSTGLIEIKNLTQSMGTLIQNLITVISGLISTNSVPGAPVTLSPATIALLTAEAAKWALLLKS